jgi:ATPase subunit of ABC transporter with duplicated ATPase domains
VLAARGVTVVRGAQVVLDQVDLVVDGGSRIGVLGRNGGPVARRAVAGGLAILMAKGTNLLILYEPSNHLDLDALEELEEALAGFDGTLMVVTHDRRMLASLRVSRRLEVAAGTVRELPLPTTVA